MRITGAFDDVESTFPNKYTNNTTKNYNSNYICIDEFMLDL